MLKKILLFLMILSLLTCTANAIKIKVHKVRGVKPSDRVSTLEFNPSTIVIDDSEGISSSSMTFKLYHSLNKNFTIGTEVPLARYENGQKSVSGLGDIMLAASAAQKFDDLNLGLSTEFTLPTATYDALSIGKWQFSPSAYAEKTFFGKFLLAAGYKHYISFAGPSSKEDINLGRIRIMAAYLSPSNWWLMLDPKYYIDYQNGSRAELVAEAEAGIMLYDEISLYLKPGWHVAGNRNTLDWSLSFGVKLLSI